MALFWNVLAIRAAAIGKSGNRGLTLTLGSRLTTVKLRAGDRHLRDAQRRARHARLEHQVVGDGVDRRSLQRDESLGVRFAGGDGLVANVNHLGAAFGVEVGQLSSAHQ